MEIAEINQIIKEFKDVIASNIITNEILKQKIEEYEKIKKVNKEK